MINHNLSIYFPKWEDKSRVYNLMSRTGKHHIFKQYGLWWIVRNYNPIFTELLINQKF